MTANPWTTVDRYLDERLIGPDEALEAALRASDAAGLPAIAVSATQGKLLFLLARAMGASRILELGTLGGYSGIWLARALPAGGQLVTIEADAKHADVARGNFARAGLAPLVDLRLGSALEVLAGLHAERVAPFDFVFIDADKVNYPEYLEWAIRLGREGTLIVADNIVRDGAIVDPDSPDAAVQAARRFLTRLGEDPRVTATAIQTVGHKGYDGFAAALVTSVAPLGRPGDGHDR
jgi:predicted O-methyltransferase YrrM